MEGAPPKVVWLDVGNAGTAEIEGLLRQERDRLERFAEIQNTLTSYRMVVDQPVHRDVSEVVIPGVLRRYDTGDLLEAIYPRPVTVVSPRDALGDAVSEQDFRAALSHVFQSDQKLGAPQRIRFRLE